MLKGDKSLLFLKQYIWSVAKKLVKDNGFSMINLNEKSDVNQEIAPLHFIKNRKTTMLYIRLVPIDFIWPNHLLQDMEFANSRALQMMRQSNGRTFKFLNLYIFQHKLPEDVYQVISEASRSSEKGLDSFNGFIDLEEEQLGIPADTFEQFPITKDPFIYFFTHDEMEDPDQAFHEIMKVERKREEDIRKIFDYGMPFFTFFFIAVNALMFVIMTFAGGSTNTEILLRFGAKESFLITHGEYWRFITPIFLHIGFLHFVLNNLALYFLGQMTEKIYGSARFLFIYLMAGIIGNIGSFLFVPSSLGAGASGSIFGLFGALLYFGYIYPDLFFRTMGKDILTIIGINLVFGLVVPNIDNYAHMGGLLGGFLIASILHLPKQKSRKLTLTFFSLFLIISIISAAGWGIYNRDVKGHPAIVFEGKKALENGDLETADQIFSHLVHHYPKEAYFHFYFANTLFQEGDFVQAKQHYEQTLALQPDYLEAYYNLALVAVMEEKKEEAKKLLQKALELDPTFDKAQQLLEDLG